MISDRVCAIDPGPEKSALVIYNGTSMLNHQVLDNPQMLEYLDGLVMLYDVAIEWITGYGKPVGNETFHTCRWVGRFQQIADVPDRNLIPRREVKRYLCENVTAKDKDVRAALMDRFGGQDSVKKGGRLHGIAGDCWAALGVAVTWWETVRKVTKTGEVEE